MASESTNSELGNSYHPDPEIDAQIRAEVVESEKLDLAAGYPPRKWFCDCGASHSRGHFMLNIGVHRCLRCGYVGEGGRMSLEPGEFGT